jgi:hypothetical protein
MTNPLNFGRAEVREALLRRRQQRMAQRLALMAAIVGAACLVGAALVSHIGLSTWLGVCAIGAFAGCAAAAGNA